ncbi:hypothetical protein [Longispora fulva]|uniref:Uncharacterized protein n=1 Tax=Longispora fulva TaxID=619741 RepID=A0A8J7GG59_9ACTN|nr:hypothetical protein [Longispora fulva]MBG6135413.1 hypothetical protein [Longispora fulva]
MVEDNGLAARQKLPPRVLPWLQTLRGWESMEPPPRPPRWRRLSATVISVAATVVLLSLGMVGWDREHGPVDTASAVPSVPGTGERTTVAVRVTPDTLTSSCVPNAMAAAGVFVTVRPIGQPAEVTYRVTYGDGASETVTRSLATGEASFVDERRHAWAADVRRAYRVTVEVLAPAPAGAAEGLVTIRC